MYCRKCGNKLGDGQQVCLKCGTIIEDNAAPKTVANTNKSKVVAGILGIILGSFGVHNFYLGYNGKAVAQLLLTVLSCFILSGISALWGFIEGILILTGNIATDAAGNALTD